MSRGNNVFQVLVPSGDQALAAEGTALDALAPGQLGIFSYKTNLAILGADKAESKNFYLAVGVDKTGSGNLEDINKSSGTHIQARNVVGFTARCYTPPQPKIVEITDFSVNCEEEYGIKFEIRNQQAYRVHGYNQVIKTFLVKGSDCLGCEECGEGDCIDLVDKLVKDVNADVDGLILAEAIATEAITIAANGTAADYAVGDVVPATEFAALQAFNADEANTDVCLGLRFTMQPQALERFCDINLNYFSPRQTDVIVTKVDGFEKTGVITVTQEIVYEEGSGYDVRQLEYEAGGWNGKPGPYRVSETLGTARNGFEYYAEANEKYVVINLEYDQASIAGWLEHKNNPVSYTHLTLPTKRIV